MKRALSAAAILLFLGPAGRADPAAAPGMLLPSYRWAGGEPLPSPSLSQKSPDFAAMLDAPVSFYRASRLPIAAAFLSVSRSYGITFVLDPGLKGDVTLEVHGGTVRDLVEALARSQGYYWEQEGNLVAIRKSVVRFYEIDYPQMTRSAQGGASVVLSAQAGTGLNGALTGGNNPAPGSGTPAGTTQNDQTNLSIQQQNQNTFWSDVQSELSGMAQSGESAAVNKLAGVAIIAAPPDRQNDFRSFIDLINRRISQQVRIAARVVEVQLDSQHQLGVDWTLAATKIGGLALTGLATNTGFTALNGQTLIPSTLSGTLSAGKVSAAIGALSEQGSVRAVSNPSVLSLSNQTAFVKVGVEQTFFSLSNSTTINQSGAATPFSTTQNSYTQNPITIGTVLYVTPEVNGDGTVTVDVLPAITQLIGIDTSPDGQQTAPRMDIKSLSTIARLHPGESVMIGGLIYDETAEQSQKVPGLGDIPVLGRVFGTAGGTKTRSELVIFLTAELVR
jgi:type II secretory pathway component GspD/PulD (secretin)